jgi:hypothetical protein
MARGISKLADLCTPRHQAPVVLRTKPICLQCLELRSSLLSIGGAVPVRCLPELNYD